MHFKKSSTQLHNQRNFCLKQFHERDEAMYAKSETEKEKLKKIKQSFSLTT